MKNLPNLNLFKSELDLTYSKGLDKMEDLLMKGTTHYKHKLH